MSAPTPDERDVDRELMRLSDTWSEVVAMLADIPKDRRRHLIENAGWQEPIIGALLEDTEDLSRLLKKSGDGPPVTRNTVA